MSELKDLKRYRVITSPLPISDWGLHERGDGEFVKFSDVEALVAPAKDVESDGVLFMRWVKERYKGWENITETTMDRMQDAFEAGHRLTDSKDGGKGER